MNIAAQETKPIPRKKDTGLRNPDTLKDFIEKTLDSDKAENIEVIDLSGQSSIADYMIVASGRSSRQVSSLARNLADKIREKGMKNISVEGTDIGDWAIVDAGDVIVHVFRPEVRSYYSIEKMWQDKESRGIKTTRVHKF